jgi:hypothetical protein
MKGKQNIALFLILVHIVHVVQTFSSRQDQNFTSALDEDELDLKAYVKNYKMELKEIEEQYNKYKELVKKSKIDELIDDLEDKRDSIKSSKDELKRIIEYSNSLSSDYENDKLKNNEVFRAYREEMKSRKYNGVSEMNKLLSNFLYPDKTKQSLESIISLLGQDDTDIVKKNKTKSRTSNSFLKNEKNQQFNKMRIWSSFRLEEVFDKLKIVEAKNVNLIKAMLAGFYSSVPSSYCWVHETNLGTFDMKIPENYKKIATLVYNSTISFDAEEKAGLFIENCKPDETDCTFFCSSSDCESPEDFSSRKFKNINYLTNYACHPNFIKKGKLCYPNCEKIGMVSCDSGTCSTSKEGCDLKLPSINKEIVESFVDFLGHIYSLKLWTRFGWSNPESLKMDLKVLKKYDEENSKRYSAMDEVINNRRFFKYFYENFKENTFKFFKVELERENYNNLFDSLVVFFKWLLSDKLTFYNDKDYIKNLTYCDLKHFRKLVPENNGTLSREDKLLYETQNKCRSAFGSLLKNLKPYMSLGLVSGFVKPLCPFALVDES